MRKIEQQMVAALNQGRDEATFRRWPTATTKSRLRALGLPTGGAK